MIISTDGGGDLDKTGIYAITNLHDGKNTTYIGATSYSFRARLACHESSLRHGYHGNEYLQRAYNKYGEESFLFRVLEIVDNANIIPNKEQYWINRFLEIGPIYNCDTIVTSCSGRKLSEEHKRKIGEASKGRKLSKDAIEKIRKKLTGYKHTQEARNNMGKSRIGHETSDATKSKISKSLMRHPVSDKTRQIWSEQRRGHGHRCSEETRRKLSVIHKGKMTGERREALAARNSKPYPSFIHNETGDIIPIGVNLTALCREHGFGRFGMRSLISGKTKSYRGWQLYQQ